MAAQTATSRMGRSRVQNMYNLQRELAGSAPADIRDNTTVTLTIVYTTATDAITIDASVT